MLLRLRQSVPSIQWGIFFHSSISKHVTKLLLQKNVSHKVMDDKRNLVLDSQRCLWVIPKQSDIFVCDIWLLSRNHWSSWKSPGFSKRGKHTVQYADLQFFVVLFCSLSCTERGINFTAVSNTKVWALKWKLLRIKFQLILSVSIIYKTKFCLIFLVSILDIFLGMKGLRIIFTFQV